jgi:thiosulfate/3-mercaptopyruvate sulfurtransferase
MSYAHPEALVDVEWLHDNMDSETIRIIDATYCMPAAATSGHDAFADAHIPGALHLDIDAVANTKSPYAHTFPSLSTFERHASTLGITNDHHVIVYDRANSASAAARVWWLFRCFGHKRVSVLNGGFTAWQRSAMPVQTGEATATPASFEGTFQKSLVWQLQEMRAHFQNNGETQILDVRSPERFAGTAAEPWPVQNTGHMPKALNIPFLDFIDADTGFYKDGEDIRAICDAAQLNIDQPIVCSCGSGVTACVAAVALFLIGHQNAAIYDGSWAEWGNEKGAPIISA